MGLYTISAATKVGLAGTVLAIQPSSRDLAGLEANVELNKLTNVQLSRVAVSDYGGETDPP